MRGAVTVQQLQHYNSTKKAGWFCRVISHRLGKPQRYKIKDHQGTHPVMLQKCMGCQQIKITQVLIK